MSSRPIPVALIGAMALGVASSLAPTAGAAGADPTHACVEAADEGQRQRDQGSLVAASRAFATCAAEECPALVRESCGRWQQALEPRIPSVVLASRDERGLDVIGARASLDGRPYEPVTGRAIQVDPGPHEIVSDAPGHASVRLPFVAREGEKLRSVSVVLPLAANAPSPVGSAPSLAPPLFAGGAAAAGLVVFAVFGAIGQSNKNDLSSRCAMAGTCSPSAVSSARIQLAVADVGLVVGLAGAAVAAVLLVRRASAATSKSPPSASSFAPVLRF